MAKEQRKESPLLAESGGSTSIAAANHPVEAEVASQDKQYQKSSEYHHYDTDVHVKITKSACKKMR